MANIFGFGPMGIDTAPQSPDQSPEAKRKLFDTLSIQHKVPANVLMALSEGGKADPGLAASKIAEGMAAGKKVEDIVGPDVMNRAYDIADELYPVQKAPPATASTLRKVGDAGVAIAQGVLDDGVVSAVRGAGELATAAANALTEPVNAAIQGLTGTNPEMRSSNPLTGVTDWASEKIQGAGDALTSEATKQDIANSQITGNITDPSSISFGENPSVNGVAQQVVRTFGSLVPAALAAWFSGGSTLAVGALGAAGAAGDQAKASDDALDQMAKTVLPDGRTQIEAESEVYREYRAKGLSPDDALVATKSDAAQLAAVMSAPVGMIGGGIEAKLFNPASKLLGKAGIAPRVAGRAALGALSEGPQEAGEVMAGRVGSNMGAGTNQSLTDNTAADFILGALGGGAMAGGAAAMGLQEGEAPRPAPQPERLALPAPQPERLALPAPQPERLALPAPQPERLALPAPNNGGTIIPPAPPAPISNTRVDGSAVGQGATSGGQAIPGQTPGVAPASPVPPAGPISRVAAAAPDLTPVPEAPPPTALFPDQKPGNAVQLLDPETGVIHDAAFLGETPEGVSVRINGTPITLTPEEFDQARNGAAKVEAEAKAAPKKAPAKAKAPAQRKTPALGQGGQVAVPDVGAASLTGIAPNGNGDAAASAADPQVSQGQIGADSDGQQPAVASPAQGSPSATGPGELSPALTRPSAAPMAAPSERVQPDMLGGEAKTEAQLAAKERTKREWGRFLGMAEGAKGANETELDGRTVLIRPGKVVIRARVDGASDLDFRIDTEGMSRDQIAAATRGALSELDRRAPINRKAEEYKPAPARAPEAAPIPGATPADDVAADPAKTLPDMPPGMETPVSQVSQVSQVSRPEAPGKAAPTIRHIRDKAAVLMGVPKDQPPSVGKVSFKWDEAEGGFIFSRAKEGDVRKTLGLDEKVATVPGNVAETQPPAPATVPTATEVAAAAAQADPNPTDAQKEAGNYQMGHIQWNGLDLSIETAKGSLREGKDRDGEEWSVKMPADYGYIRRTEGADGDHVDFYMGPAPDAAEVYVIDQVDAETRAFDEHKVMIGFRNRKHALDTYALGFSDGKGKDRLGAHKIMTVAEFLEWVKTGDHSKPVRLVQKAEAPLPPVPAPTEQDASEMWNGLSQKARRMLADEGGLDGFEVAGKSWGGLSRAEKYAIAKGRLAIKVPALEADFAAMYRQIMADNSPKQPEPAPITAPASGMKPRDPIEAFRSNYADPNSSLPQMRANEGLAEVAAYADWLGSLTDAQWKKLDGVFTQEFNPFLSPSTMRVADRKADLEAALALPRQPWTVLPDTIVADGLPEGARLVEGSATLQNGKFAVISAKEQMLGPWSGTKAEAVSSAKEREQIKKHADQRNAERATIRAKIAERLLAGEAPTEGDIKALGLKYRAHFSYISPVVQELFGISSRKVREAMGDALYKVTGDSGAEYWSAKTKEALQNAATWANASQRPTAAPVPVAALKDLAAAVQAEVARSGLAGKVTPKVVRGLLNAAGVPIQGRQAGATIEVNPAAADPVGVARHEIIHALRDPKLWDSEFGLFTRAEWLGLVKDARSDTALVERIAEQYSDRPTSVQTEEAVAETYRLWAQGRDAAGPVARAFAKVRAYLEAVANALRGQGFQSAALTMDRIARGEIGGRGPDGGGSRNTQDRRQIGTDTAAFKAWFGDSKAVDKKGMSEMREDLRIQIEESEYRVVFSVADGANVAAMDAFKTEDGGLQVDVTEVPEAMQRQGVSTALHDAGIAWAKERGGRFLSGYELSADGRAFYEGLRKKGYSVTKVDLENGESAYELDMPAAESRFDLAGAKAKAMSVVGSRHWRNPGEFVSNLVTDAMAGRGDSSALALVPGRPLFAEMGKRLMGAKAYLRGKEEMDALRNDWHSRADEVAQKWMALRNKMPEANTEMMDLMHRTTLSGIDPSRPDTWRHAMEAPAQAEIARFGPDAKEWAFKVMEQIDQHKQSYAKLRAEFTALPAEFQALYPEVRDNYKKMNDDFEKAVLENIANATRISLKSSERAHRKEMERIRDEGLEGEEREDAIAKADARLDNVKKRGGFGAKTQIQVLRKLFESNKLKGPYFPLARFGVYFVTIRDDKGARVSFTRFEKVGQQQAFIRELKEAGETRIDFGRIDDSAKMREQVNPAFVAEIENLMAESGASNEVLDALWQRYLETLPDQSIRTAKIHRKGRAGYSNDALRAFGSHMFHGAHQLARLKYGLVLEEHLNDAEEEARLSDDPNRAGFIVSEMKKRHDFAMNPKGSSVVAAMSGLAFVWYLGATPAAALANISQTTVVGIPILSAQFNKAGVSGVAKALMDATKDFAAGRGQKITDTWTVENSPKLTQDERAAMAEAHRRGIIDRTQAHDLASVAETGVEYNPVWEKWMKRISLFFHHAERFNREVTFLAAYRLAKADGQNADDAIHTAADMTYKTHFDMQNTSRPRFMQNDIGKILTTFRAFTVNMLWRLFRDSHQALNGKTKEERREARAQLVGVTLSLMAHAGIRGTWGYGLIMLLLGTVSKLAGGGDDDDLEEWLQDALLMEGDNPGVAMWNYAMGAALNGVPGQVMGVDLTDRIGMPNLWFRGQDRDLEGADLYSAYVGDVLGPVYSVGQGFFRGAQLAGDGEFWRGTEAAVPKVIRDAMKSARYLGEGAQTLNGDSLVENVNPYQALMQGIGFTPAEISERYDINTRLKNHEKRIIDRRSGLQKEAAASLTSGQGIDPGLLDQIKAFNREFPEYPITADTIRQSAQATARASQRQEFGVSLNPKLNDRLRGERAPAIYD